MGTGIQQKVTELLGATNTLGGYTTSLVCTAEGLLIASHGEGADDEDMAAFTSLFEDVVQRARRDLYFETVDEVTLLDPGRGRYVIRPLLFDDEPLAFLVVRAPRHKTWRRNTNRLVPTLCDILRPLLVAVEEVA